MDNFWQWMIKKKYADIDYSGIYWPSHFGSKAVCESEPFTKQMLIGYMIEYLYCNKSLDFYAGILDIPIDIDKGKGNINKVYKYLEAAINNLT